MSSQDHEVLVQHLSVDRLQSYLNVTHGHLDQALELYKWNTEISAEVFKILADVEIFLRNVIDRELQYMNATLGNQNSWFDSPTTNLYTIEILLGISKYVLKS